MSLAAAWTALRHGGNLLSPQALDKLPARDRAPSHLADRLRGALVDLPPDGPATGEALSALLDLVLESLCGVPVGWRKGPQVTAADGRRLLDGTVFKPRRLLDLPEHERLAVFTTPVSRVGVGTGRRAVAQVVEYLRRAGVPFGLLTNGREWRLLWAEADALAWVEWDADRWLNAEVLSEELEVFRRVISAPALARRGAMGSPLANAIRDTRRGQTKLSKELGERVRQAVEALLRARAPVVAPAWEQHAATDLYIAACHVVMRLVVVLFAEARELLPIDSPIYHQAYSLRGLLDQLDRTPRERRRARAAAWPRLVALFRLLHGGSWHPALRVQEYGGELFRAGDPAGEGVQRALALLESLKDSPDDDVIHHILDRLTRTMARPHPGAPLAPAPVDFTELTSEYIGILYEGLLDYELKKAGDEPVVFLNLGDQPALPLDRLEGMDDKALAALVEKAVVKRAAASDDEGGDEEEAAEAPEEAEPEEAPGEDVTNAEEPSANDPRAEARRRAVAWGRRAALAGKLVKKGKTNDPAHLAQLDAAARQLIFDVKLPGELYLVRWGGTRKGAGTFYTPRALTTPTVRRTLEPLLYTVAADGAERVVRPPEALLALKVCDPAMGSGSFLVAALRVLTDAVVESLHAHGRITPINGRTVVVCEAFPEADRSLPTDGFDDRLTALVRRAVVEHCLYGVDRDPLAVELGRVALWVETLDRRLPFTFLDHKLRCGDALVGTWLDRFRDYPLLAFDRESPDKKWRGVHHPADAWHEALKVKRGVVIAEQVDLLSGQAPMFPGTSDDELKAAVARVRRLYRDLRAVPAGLPQERARIWRERIQKDPAMVQVRAAFDLWCALWFWPLNQLSEAPGPRTLHAPSEAAKTIVKTVRDRLRFFHWELEFPDVFTELGAGFDAVVGNPPWENTQPNPMEYFTNEEPLFRSWGRLAAEAWQRELFDRIPTEEQQWLNYVGRFKEYANWVRHSGHPFGIPNEVPPGFAQKSWQKWHQIIAARRGNCRPAHPFVLQEGRVFTYRLFAEAALALSKNGGRIGIIVPSGIYSDAWSRLVRRELLENCRLEWLYAFENRLRIFDIHASFKFCVLVASVGDSTVSVRTAFMRVELDDWGSAVPPHSILDRDLLVRLSPTTLSIPEVQSLQDLAYISKIFSKAVLLGDSSKESWRLTFNLEFMMNSRPERFPPVATWAAKGYQPNALGIWYNSNGETALPLYEGRMVGQFDFSQKGWRTGKGRTALWDPIMWPHKVLQPQFLMARQVYADQTESAASKIRARFDELSFDDKESCVQSAAGLKIGFMDIGSATNTRTMTATLIPGMPCGNKVPVLYGPATTIPAAVACLNSFAYDAQVRLKLTGQTLNYFIVAQTPLPTYDPPSIVALNPIVFRLAMCHAIFAPYWLAQRKLAGVERSVNRWAITPHERLRLRCMLDAIVAALYGLHRDDFAWILRDCDHPAARLSEHSFCRALDPKGFWRVDKAQDPELRHSVLSLVAFDDLTRAIVAGGSRDAGIQAFCDQHDGDGWMLPETVTLAELGLTRSVDVSVYDDRARAPQPVRNRLGERFLPWQLAQSPEESWAECERHAKAILEGAPAPAPPAPPAAPVRIQTDLGPLFRGRP